MSHWLIYGSQRNVYRYMYIPDHTHTPGHIDMFQIYVSHELIMYIVTRWCVIYIYESRIHIYRHIWDTDQAHEPWHDTCVSDIYDSQTYLYIVTCPCVLDICESRMEKYDPYVYAHINVRTVMYAYIYKYQYICTHIILLKKKKRYISHGPNIHTMTH